MRIFLTNDDGYRAEGINELRRALVEYGHTVLVVAPEGGRSCASHSISDCSEKPLRKIEDGVYALDGQPADCVLEALFHRRLDFVPDVVISGINHGYNLSSDILYSGTCGAAGEAVLSGFKAIAVSESVDAASFRSARFVASALEELMPLLDNHSYLNINIPPRHSGVWKCASVLPMRHRGPDGGENSLFSDGDDAASDREICRRGYISVSSLEAFPVISDVGTEKLMEMEKGREKNI